MFEKYIRCLDVGSMDIIEYVGFEIVKTVFWVLAITASIILMATCGGV